jgi:TatD DNase family protein
MKFVDAHIHLSDKEYEGNIQQIMQEAKDANIAAIVSNSMDLRTSIRNLRLAEQYPALVHAALGIHPWTVNTLTEEELHQTCELILKQKRNKAVVAIGEIGLDSKYAKIWSKQLEVFDSMLHLAEKFNMPIIVHSRGTTAQVLNMLKSYRIKKVLLHWFSNPISALAEALEKGFYISEGLPTTYSKGIRDVVKRVPLTSLLTETDGPVRFFKPPFNGRQTTSAFIPKVVQAIAEIKKTNVQTVAEQIAKNSERFFRIKITRRLSKSQKHDSAPKNQSAKLN